MNRDSLPALLHCYHALGGNPRALRQLLEKYDHDPERIRAADSAQPRAQGMAPVVTENLTRPQRALTC